MRPRGAVRLALEQAARDLCHEGSAVTRYALAAAAGLCPHAVAHTVRDMRRAGELMPCGEQRLPHARRGAVLYRPIEQHERGALALQRVTQAWGSGRMNQAMDGGR